jgi:serine/threonine-protein kinase
LALKRTNLQERYELREVLGRGGMGVVYKALDRLMKREVALKTILDIENPATLQLFYKEWSILATMVHPNVINIYDIGEFDQDGVKKPFFVMPLLPGVTLDRLIKDGSPRLSVAGVLEIVTQAAHGLHAAHEQGLVHRDVKPSNIFVMDDNSVKIIDFGIAREVSGQSKTTLKGTLFYIAPEQLQMKPPSALSDLFALGVVTYEALTRRRPFQGANETEVVEAILHHSPPPVSAINHEVSYSISQVVHKAMAKQPWHRFFNMREFADALLKASRNEPLEYFDASKIKPRLVRAAKSFEAGDYGFASEVLSELEAEGHLDQEIALLRGQVDQAVRQTRIRQMLESARRFFEATEYPLALRKIQEALELDPNDADALSLKAQVEKERREKKISEWIALARQHLENQAFRQAREALENVVQMKPNETEALGLLAEVGRRESEVSRVREEKARLYQAAQQSWEKGEVTSALSKLEVLVAMDRDLPESDTGRSSTYQNFYNQVHSEHNSLKNSYEEARRNLAADNFEAAMAVCRQYLAKYPNHALFQALKFDVEERQRQKLSQVIAETDRRVDAEADLDRRAGILEEALKAYPGESHFERAVRLVRDKRDLVNSIVAKARFFEERGQFNDALDQWQILKSIHDKQPGLPFEIQRLMKRRDQQAHENSKARWVEQTDKYLEGGDYKRALQTVESALTEFPGEAELLELQKLVHKSLERGSQALECLSRARELSEKGSSEEALAALREAYNLDSRNTVIRTVLMNSLLEQARRVVDSDWEAADAFVQEVLHLEPTHAQAQSLASRIADRKREDFIAWCLAQARRMQTDGDIDGATAVIGQGLGAYPNEPRLLQLQATLQRALAEKQRQAVRIAPREQPREQPKEQAKEQPREQPRERPRTATGMPAVAAPPAAGEKPPASVREDVTLDLPAVAAGSPPAAPPAEPAPAAPVAQAAEAQPEAAAEPSVKKPAPEIVPAPAGQAGPVAPAPPVPPDAVKPPAGVEPAAKPPMTADSKRLLAGTAAAAALLLLIATVVTVAHNRKKAPPLVLPPGAKYQIVLRSSPEGAEIRFNGDSCGTSTCSLALAAGSYQAEAQLTGYENATVSVPVGPGAPGEVTLTLTPLPPRVAIFTDLAEGTVNLDGAAAGKIQDGGAEVPNLTPGKHTLSVASGDSTASIPVEITPGAVPKLVGPMEAKNLRAFLVAGYGGAARVYSSATGYMVTLDGKLVGELPPDGLPLENLTQGTHELALDTQTSGHDKIVFEAQPAATLYVSLGASQNLGVLYVSTNQDQAQLYLNGEKYKRDTKRGRLVVYLFPKKYTVAMQKDGFAPTPPQTVDIKRGEETKVSFDLQPAKATLMIHRTQPGTEVLVDGVRVGAAGTDGEFQIASVEPGRHSVTLRHDRYKPLQSDQTFSSGKTVELPGALEPMIVNGTLRFDVTPAGVDVHLRIRREGESQDRDVAGPSVSLPEGTYTVTATAPQFQPASATVRVGAGATAVASLPLRRADAPKTPSKTASAPSGTGFGLEDWMKTGGWTQGADMITHRGGDYVLAPVEIESQGNVRFTAVSVRGRHVEWVVGFRDDRNYYLFQLDDKNITRYEVANGTKSAQVKVPHGLDRKKPMSIGIGIAPRAITTNVLRGGQWAPIDNWEVFGSLVRGKFGFHITGGDEIGLQEFKLGMN